MNSIFADLPTTVFETMSALARETGAINLGQGFPDDPGPEDVREVAAKAVLSGYNQYPPMMGLPELRKAISDHYSHWQDLEYDPQCEVMVTSGATEALAATLLALIKPGDEVVLFEPMYDAYMPLVRRAGGIARFVTLKPPGFGLERRALEAVFNNHTKAVVFNDPLNPTATVSSEAERMLLAEFCTRYRTYAVCDEVWEHVVFDGHRHSSLAALPGMRELTIKIGSAGKIFSLTGWKVGFVCASEKIMRVIGKAHQFLTFTTPPNLQVAVAYGLGKEDDYFETLRSNLARSRDRLTRGLEERGFHVLPSKGTYFLNIDIAPLGEKDDVTFCHRLVQERGVAAIPVSAFYINNPVKNLVRLCFAKKDETLDEALWKLEGLIQE